MRPATEVPTARPDQTAGAVRAALPGRSYECADVAVLDGESFVGLVPAEALLTAGADVAVRELIDAGAPVVRPYAPRERVAARMAAARGLTAAVVHPDGRFAGLVPARRMVAVLLAEHDEDLARLGGYLASTKRARLAAEEPIGRRLWHRLPWLLLGLLGAMASALVVGAFEAQLDAKVLLAFFVPAVVYMADAVGTQTETVVIRGLTVGVGVRAVVRRELVTGLAIGAIVACAFFPFAALAWGDVQVAAAVGLALLASCSITTLVAMALPWAFQRLGRDPAFGSGPLATVAQDLLSIAVYLGIATALAT